MRSLVIFSCKFIEIKNIGAKHNVFLKVTPKTHTFWSTVIRTLHLVQPLTKVSASKAQVVLMKFVSKEAQNSNVVGAILNSTILGSQTAFRDVIPSEKFGPNGFPWTYGCSWAIIILSQTCSKLRNYSIEDSEVDNRWEKKVDFAGLVKDTNSVLGFSLSRQFRVGRNDVA